MLPGKTAMLLGLILLIQAVVVPQVAISSEVPTLPAASQIYVNGTVTNNTGGFPVAGANVSFFNYSTGAYVGSALTNASGFYNITLDAGVYNISAAAADHYTAWERNINLSANGTRDMIIFEIPGRMEGTVDDSVHPVAGAVVNITYIPVNQTVPVVLSAATGADGSFSLENITAGSYTIDISVEGYPPEQRSVKISWNRTTVTTVHLSGAELTGVVKDDSGTPMEADISVDNGTAWFNTTSGPDGGYSISGLRAGDYNISAVKTGYVAYRSSTSIAAGERAWENCTLMGGSIAGNITDDAGRPINGAAVRLLSSGTEVFSTTSDAAGSFGMMSIPTGDYVLSASMTGYLSVSENVHVAAGHTTYLDVALTGGALKGLISDDAGRLVSGALVELLGSDYSSNSNNSGNYTLSGVPEGDYYVKASKDGYLTSITESPVHISPGALVFHNFTLRGGTLTGTVDNGTSELGGVNVTLILTTGENLTATTDPSGRYIIKGIPAGVYAVTARLEGYHNSTVGGVVITAGETTALDLTMDELQGSISGNVRSSTGPVEGARVWVSITDGIRFAYTDAAGNYTITDVPAGIYNVTAEKDGYYPDYVAGVTVTRGAVVSDVNFTLEGKLSRLSGVVSNGTYPIVGVNIEILELKYSTETDPYGRYVMENIPPGTYTVVATKRGYQANATYGVVISMGEVMELNFTLEEIPGIVWGYVRDADGKPIVQATVEIAGEAYTTTTDINGYYKLAGVTPGIYALRIYKSGYETSVISGVNITTEYENHVDVTLQPAGGGDNGDEWSLIPGMDMVHSFMVIGLIIVLSLMFISILYIYRHGKKFSETRFMNMLKQMAEGEEAEETTADSEGAEDEENSEGPPEEGREGEKAEEKEPVKKRLRKKKLKKR